MTFDLNHSKVISVHSDDRLLNKDLQGWDTFVMLLAFFAQWLFIKISKVHESWLCCRTTGRICWVRSKKKYGRSAHLVGNRGEADTVWCFKAQISKTLVFTGDAQQPNSPLWQELECCELSVSIWQLICQSFRLLVGIILSPCRHANPPPLLSGGNMSSPMARTAGQTHMHTAQ